MYSLRIVVVVISSWATATVPVQTARAAALGPAADPMEEAAAANGWDDAPSESAESAEPADDEAPSDDRVDAETDGPQAEGDDASDTESGAEASSAVPEPKPASEPDAEPAAEPGAMAMRPDASKGTGLIIAAGVTGGLAILTAVGRMAAVGTCIDEDALTEEQDSNVSTCIRSSRALLALTLPGWLLNGATWGLAPAAGAVRGRYDGISYAWDGKPQRVANAYIGAGAGVLGVGIVGWIATRASVFRFVRFDSVKGFRNGLIGYFGVLQLTSSMIAVGGGLLAYGVAYKQKRKHYENQLRPQVRLVPALGRRYAGLSLAGRF